MCCGSGGKYYQQQGEKDVNKLQLPSNHKSHQLMACINNLALSTSRHWRHASSIQKPGQMSTCFIEHALIKQ